MARFIGRVQGSRGGVTRLGSGINVSANGWNSGVRVIGSVNGDGDDVFQIILTGGSNGGSEREIARVLDGRLVSVEGRPA